MNLTRANQQILRKLAVVTVAMFGFGYALVPMYRAICEYTGINILALAEQAIPAHVRCRRTPKSTPTGPSRWNSMPTHAGPGSSARTNVVCKSTPAKSSR